MYDSRRVGLRDKLDVCEAVKRKKAHERGSRSRVPRVPRGAESADWLHLLLSSATGSWELAYARTRYATPPTCCVCRIQGDPMQVITVTDANTPQGVPWPG